MRRLMLSVLALSWLGFFAGCHACGSLGCGSSDCGSSGCGTGVAGGCGLRHGGSCGGYFGGYGNGHGADGSKACLYHGICDCDIDDHCSMRAPWIRFAPIGAAGYNTPVEAIPEPAAKDPPKELPKDLPKGGKL